MIEFFYKESRTSRWQQRERKSENFFACWWGWASLRPDKRFEFHPYNRFRSLSTLLPIKSETIVSPNLQRLMLLSVLYWKKSVVPFSTNKAFYIYFYLFIILILLSLTITNKFRFSQTRIDIFIEFYRIFFSRIWKLSLWLSFIILK